MARIAPLALAQGIVFLGFALLIPVLPYWAQAWGASPADFGWVMAVYAAVQVAATPWAGRLADRWGRKAPVLLGIAGLTVTWLGLLTVHQWVALLAWRAGAGLAAASVLPATTAWAADLTPGAHDRARAMGLLGAATGLGFVVGPALGGWLSRAGTAPLLLVVATLTALAGLLVVRLPEPPAGPRSRPAPAPSPRRPVWLILLVSGTVTLSLAMVEATLAFFLEARWHQSAATLGWLLTGMGLLQAGVQFRMLPGLLRRWTPARVAGWGILLSGLALLTLTTAPGWPVFVLSLWGFGLTGAVVTPTLRTVLSQVRTHERGEMLGRLEAWNSAGRVLGPVAGGWAFMVHPWLPGALGAGLRGAAGLAAFGVLGLMTGTAWTAESPGNPLPRPAGAPPEGNEP